MTLLCMNVTGETRGRKLCIRRANASTRSLILPRYFFRFSSATECVPDNFGAELPNFKAAHLMSETKIEENKQARKGTRATEASTTTVMRVARTLANEDGAENLAT
jgi:hypothetical protein